MDGPRRSTMLPPADNLGNVRSGIPLPMSAVKKQTPAARLRQSFAGPPTSNPRHSLYPTQNGNHLLQSESKPGAAYGRTPLRNSVHGARQSIVPFTPALAQTGKDPRALRDKTVQQTMRNEILSWLQQTEFTGNVSKQILSSPTARDFRSIFEHLIGLLDPSYQFGEKGIKFEDEVILLLKAHYRYADSIDKKWLAAPASMHSWPSLLGALHWLVGLSKAKLHYLNSDDPTVQSVEQIPEVFEEPQHHFALAYMYYMEAYGLFLSGSDNFQRQDEILEDRYAKKNESILSDLESRRTELRELSAKLQQLKDRPDRRAELEEEHRHLSGDTSKFELVNEHLQKRKAKATNAIAAERQKIVEITADLQSYSEEQARLSETIKAQNLSPEEVTRMNSEQELLSRTVSDLKKKTTELNTLKQSLEVDWAKRTDAVELAVEEYNQLLIQLGIFPTVPPPLPPTDLQLETNFSSDRVEQLVRRVVDGRGAELKPEIKTVLDAIAELSRQQLRVVEDEEVDVDNELDQLSVECEKEEEDIIGLDRQIALLQDQAEDTKEAAQREALISNGEASRLERELAHARSAALANGVGVRSILQSKKIAYQEQIEKTDRLRDETVRAIIKSSNDIALFKEAVSDHLNRLRQFADDN